VPLLTVCGNTFAGRVASSLLTTHGEPSFITPSLETYELRLNELLAEGDELAVARRRFTAKRATSSLFDTTGFVRDWEAMLSAVCAEGQSDNGPGA
jgi:predicted O-linked N-acetylglucosamine transferase (SPINDLY family)